MARRNIVVVGASAGGVEATSKIVAGLPASFPGAVFVVLHIPPHVPSHLQSVLARVSALPVETASDGAPIHPGRIYVAVPDRHIALDEGRMRVTRGPRENRARPAIDVLFRSAAYHYRKKVIGVLLSGNLDDGTAGMWAIKDRGGIAVVQSPEEALFSSMPRSAIEHVAVDHVLPLAEIPAVLGSLCSEKIGDAEGAGGPEATRIEMNVALGARGLTSGAMNIGTVTPSTCPECHGVLVEIREGPILRFRCHVGHAFSAQTLLAMVEEEVEHNLSSTLRALDERLILLRRMEEAARQTQDEATANEYARKIASSELSGAQFQRMLTMLDQKQQETVGTAGSSTMQPKR